MADVHPIPHDEYWRIFSKVPRLTVEIIVPGEKGVLLTLRDIEPCKGMWHLPGGSVQYGELLKHAVKRIAKRKLGIEVTKMEFLGYIEYPSHFTKGLDSPVGMAFKIISYKGQVAPEAEASAVDWFPEAPSNMHDEQTQFLAAHALIKAPQPIN
jgi:ADP-ribose pyrophosphatase YjhB (NUDIX family)